MRRRVRFDNVDVIPAEAAAAAVGTRRFPIHGVSAYTPMCPKGTEGVFSPPCHPRQSVSEERGPQRTLRHEVPDRLTPSGMRLFEVLSIWKALMWS